MATVTRRRAPAAVAPLAPGLRDAAGRVLDRAVAAGIAGGMLAMYATRLLVSA